MISDKRIESLLTSDEKISFNKEGDPSNLNYGPICKIKKMGASLILMTSLIHPHTEPHTQHREIIKKEEENEGNATALPLPITS